LIVTTGGKYIIPFVADKSVGHCLDGAVQVDVKLPTAYRKLLIAVLELPIGTMKLPIAVAKYYLIGVKFHYLMLCSLLSSFHLL
jgi:hypothetical protein